MPNQNVLNAYGQSEDEFWTKYLAGRPKVPRSLFQQIFGYHESHGGAFDIVNDIGAGPGTFSTVLAQKIKQVILAEPSKQTLDVAKRILNREDHLNFQYYDASAEESVLPGGGVDMAFVCNALHHANVDRAVDAIAKQLKPGGTFCVALFGGVAILLNTEAQRVWAQLFELGISRTTAALGEKSRPVMQILDGGYDAVPLPSRYFESGAQRIQINVKQNSRAFCIASNATKDIPTISNVGVDDTMTEIEDDGWSFEAGLDQLKLTHSTHPWTNDPSDFEPYWKKLQSILGDGKVQGCWIASLLLATRNSQSF